MDRAAMADMIRTRSFVSGSAIRGCHGRVCEVRLTCTRRMPSTARRRIPGSRCAPSCLPCERRANSSSISQPVRLDYEVAGCLAQIDSGPALHFTNVEGASGAAHDADRGQSAQFAATVCQRDWASRSKRCRLRCLPRSTSLCRIAWCRRRPVRKRSFADPSLADELPIPRFFEKEGGPYITAGAIVAQGPAQRPHQPVDRAADAAWREPGLRRHRAQPPPRGIGAGGSRARRKTGHRGLRRKSSGGPGGGMPLSRPRRG